MTNKSLVTICVQKEGLKNLGLLKHFYQFNVSIRVMWFVRILKPEFSITALSDEAMKQHFGMKFTWSNLVLSCKRKFYIAKTVKQSLQSLVGSLMHKVILSECAFSQVKSFSR